MAPVMRIISTLVESSVHWKNLLIFLLHVRRRERHSLAVTFSDDIEPRGFGISHFGLHLVHPEMIIEKVASIYLYKFRKGFLPGLEVRAGKLGGRADALRPHAAPGRAVVGRHEIVGRLHLNG